MRKWLIAVALSIGLPLAAAAYTTNTSGTTLNGVIEALTDIFNKLTSGVSVTCTSGCGTPATAALSSNTPATLAVTNSSGRVAFADNTTTYPAANLLNDGATEFFFALGDNTIVATVARQALPAGRSICVAIGANTNVAAITASSTSTLTVKQATSCPPESGGGGSGGGGGGGAVTAADGALATEGTTTDPACATDNGTCTLEALIKRLNQRITTLNSTLNAPMQNSGGSLTANAGANLNTSALGTKANQDTNSATTAHTCATAGYSELGCLGQMDDDIKGVGTIQGNVNVTPTDCSIALTTAATPQNIITAGATLHGFTIANIDTTAGSGEPVWISLTTTAAASTIASYPLAAPTATTFAGLSSYTSPIGFGVNTSVSVVAATAGHKISCTKW